MAWHNAALGKIDGQALERIGLHGLTGEDPPATSDEEEAEIELRKLRMFRSQLKSMGHIEPPPPANEDTAA